MLHLQLRLHVLLLRLILSFFNFLPYIFPSLRLCVLVSSSWLIGVQEEKECFYIAKSSGKFFLHSHFTFTASSLIHSVFQWKFFLHSYFIFSASSLIYLLFSCKFPCQFLHFSHCEGWYMYIYIYICLLLCMVLFLLVFIKSSYLGICWGLIMVSKWGLFPPQVSFSEWQFICLDIDTRLCSLLYLPELNHV